MIDNDKKYWTPLEIAMQNEDPIIPIIGPDALVVEHNQYDGSNIKEPFYRLVSKKLIESFIEDKKYDIDPLSPEFLEDTWVLHKAVKFILSNISGINKQAVNNRLSDYIIYYSNKVSPAESLQLLAGISQFNLFVSLTPDNLLEQAIEQFGNSRQAKIYEYSQSHGTELVSKMSSLNLNECNVFHILGYCRKPNIIPMHEEDTLEILYHLQSEPGIYANILSELRKHNKLFIGCNLPDWLGRSILRILSEYRLYEKSTEEFIYPCDRDTSLNDFLARFSTGSHEYKCEMQPEEFIKKLVSYSKPLTLEKKYFINIPITDIKNPSLFISYHSPDKDYAKNIYDTLKNIGFNVWFDKTSLGGGDKWSQCIEKSINECDFFMPIFSEKSDQDDVNCVYWEEWKHAKICLEKLHKNNKYYFLPVGIDSRAPSAEFYKNIWVRCGYFTDTQIFHAPNGTLGKSDQEKLEQIYIDFKEGVR